METKTEQHTSSQEPVKLDIFQHMKIGIKNKEENCFCENDINKKIEYIKGIQEIEEKMREYAKIN